MLTEPTQTLRTIVIPNGWNVLPSSKKTRFKHFQNFRFKSSGNYYVTTDGKIALYVRSGRRRTKHSKHRRQKFYIVNFTLQSVDNVLTRLPCVSHSFRTAIFHLFLTVFLLLHCVSLSSCGLVNNKFIWNGYNRRQRADTNLRWLRWQVHQWYCRPPWWSRTRSTSLWNSSARPTKTHSNI